MEPNENIMDHIGPDRGAQSSEVVEVTLMTIPVFLISGTTLIRRSSSTWKETPDSGERYGTVHEIDTSCSDDLTVCIKLHHGVNVEVPPGSTIVIRSGYDSDFSGGDWCIKAHVHRYMGTD